jgi:L-ascorbate metabolism protein UlaG (beta-lactamase superfamily)
MSQSQPIFQHLGQTGLRIDLDGILILIDPYLSHSVAELDSPDLVRQIPIPYKPQELTNVDWILITHEHMDHCDPHTLPLIAAASPKSIFIGPEPVRSQLRSWGISQERIKAASSTFRDLGSGLKVKAVPSAHPKIRRDGDGEPLAVGWVIERNGMRMYVAGDTALTDELLGILRSEAPFDLGLLPVNEDNYYRRRRGIIGNMSIREAFGMAEELKIKSVFPVHWDLFQANGASVDEINAVYRAYDWSFSLVLDLKDMLP